LNDPDSGNAFEMLEPPAGGLTRLRARMRQDQVRRRRTLRLAVAGAGLVVIVTVVLAAALLPAWSPVLLPGLESDLLAIQAGLVEPPAATVSIRPDLRHEYAVQQIPTTNEKVVFYLVGSR